jgi:uncharacterized protein (TIGR03435 family)
VALALVATGLTFGAQDEAETTFEVTSVRPNTSDVPPEGGRGGASISRQGRRLVAVNTPLREIVRYAYELQPFQVIVGDSSVLDDRFDVEGLMPATVVEPDPSRAMLRTLLADRFRLSVRWSIQERSTYELVRSGRDELRSGGLLPSAADCGATDSLRARLAARDEPISPERFREFLQPECDMVYQPFLGRVYGGARTMSEFASLLARVPGVESPVVDRTDLAGRFDFELVFDPDPVTGSTTAIDGAPVESTAPPLFVALEEQLGLRLDRSTGPVEILVVDHVEPPTPN